MTTMLSLVQQATGEMGLTVPTQVAGNTATDVVQILALINAVGNELTRLHEWQKLDVEYRFTTDALNTTGDTTVNSAVITNIPSTTGLSTSWMVTGLNVPQDTYVLTVDSGTQVTLTQPLTGTETTADIVFTQTKYSFPSDFDRIVNRTQWDKTNQWQFLKSGYVQTTPRVRYRQLGGFFQIWPPIGAENYYGFEYISKNWVMDAGGTGKELFTADDDTCIFPDRLMILGLKLKYFEIKGFDTTAFFRDYKYQLDTAKSTDAGAPTLSLAPRPIQNLIGYDSVPDSGYGR
jgi:hypothetical protein